MKQSILLLFLVFGCHVSFSQIIFEDNFDGSGPGLAGWTVIDNDGHTINTGISFITNAWVEIDRNDANGNFGGPAGDVAAMSGSWYTSLQTSDDWMITPAINISANNELVWDAKAQDASYPDGYEVRISTTGTNINSDFDTVLFSTSAENPDWVNRTVDLASYNGQTVYIAWRNNSTDKFVLLVDNVSVAVNNLNVGEYEEPITYQIGCVNHYISIYNINSEINYKLLSLTGQTLLQGKTTLETHQIDATGLASGVYIIEIYNPETQGVFRKKIAF